MSKFTIALLLFCAFTLVGCAPQPQTSIQPQSPTTTSAKTDDLDSVDQDLADIDSSLDNLDPDTDFPSFDADNL